jgi:hypothetical protein
VVLVSALAGYKSRLMNAGEKTLTRDKQLLGVRAEEPHEPLKAVLLNQTEPTLKQLIQSLQRFPGRAQPGFWEPIERGIRQIVEID